MLVRFDLQQVLVLLETSQPILQLRSPKHPQIASLEILLLLYHPKEDLLKRHLIQEQKRCQRPNLLQGKKLDIYSWVSNKRYAGMTPEYNSVCINN